MTSDPTVQRLLDSVGRRAQVARQKQLLLGQFPSLIVASQQAGDVVRIREIGDKLQKPGIGLAHYVYLIVSDACNQEHLVGIGIIRQSLDRLLSHRQRFGCVVLILGSQQGCGCSQSIVRRGVDSIGPASMHHRCIHISQCALDIGEPPQRIREVGCQGQNSLETCLSCSQPRDSASVRR